MSDRGCTRGAGRRQPRFPQDRPDLAPARLKAAGVNGLISATTSPLDLIDRGGRRRPHHPGGAPKYTMCVPVDKLLADLEEGTASAA